MVVMKFGGSSLANGERIRNAAGIVANYHNKFNLIPTVVVSAMSGVTNSLVSLIDNLNCGNKISARDILGSIIQKHEEVASSLTNNSPRHETLINSLNKIYQQCENILASYNGYSISPQEKDVVLSIGERLSARLFASALHETGLDAAEQDAHKFIITDNNFGQAAPDINLSKDRAQKEVIPILQRNTVPVITGFIGATKQGEVTTLGRNSSDFSASVVTAILGADELVIWTDVNGVYDKDPNLYPDARFIPEIRYSEVEDMSKKGAKVIHYKTLEPLKGLNVIVKIKNTFDPEFPGTIIRDDFL